MDPGFKGLPHPTCQTNIQHSLLTNPFLQLNSTPPYPGQRFRVRGKIRTLLTLTSKGDIVLLPTLCHAVILGTSSWFSFPVFSNHYHGSSALTSMNTSRRLGKHSIVMVHGSMACIVILPQIVR